MILAIETAAEQGGVALFEGQELLGERRIGEGGPHHTAELLPAVDALLAETGRELAQVECIALSVGPGSFTGLRIGLATALGLSFGTARLIAPVPTLAALSLGAGEVEPIVPMLDARKGQVYAGVYGPGGRALAEDRVVDPLPWLEELASLHGSGPIALLGSGAQLYRSEIEKVLGARGRLLPVEAGRPRAAWVAWLGARLAAAGALLPPEQVELCYLRRPEAEEKRAAGHSEREPIS